MSSNKNKWVAYQQWEDILFLHWPVDVETLRPHVPEELELDTHDGNSWISILAYVSTDNKAKKFGRTLTSSSIHQVNVRTYVKYGEESGVYFFSMEADHKAAVKASRSLAGLPFYQADLKHSKKDEGFRIQSTRTHSGEKGLQFKCSYKPSGEAHSPEPGSLEHWLTERNQLLRVKGKKVSKSTIDYKPWKIRPADVKITKNQLLDFLPVDLTNKEPIVYYGKKKGVYFYDFNKIG
ncbi:hypothetical protein CR194_13325 [Salipaludibacillus keqinensis]|uniref:DUF2071 domain-containing protein n=1 Tax=Salipaludibacillus keqinensis TaxID=2045207 RepID=A0A323TIY0_9BACI|nr:DUF2071 domain-containing protein [Salipaludibacillus keqinensis]PYZ92643.1 hypothetical protein CR194_13325 [Salipaludibacillus keqinensis]